jgi:hypothetical protein
MTKARSIDDLESYIPEDMKEAGRAQPPVAQPPIAQPLNIDGRDETPPLDEEVRAAARERAKGIKKLLGRNLEKYIKKLDQFTALGLVEATIPVRDMKDAVRWRTLLYFARSQQWHLFNRKPVEWQTSPEGFAEEARLRELDEVSLSIGQDADGLFIRLTRERGAPELEGPR